MQQEMIAEIYRKDYKRLVGSCYKLITSWQLAEDCVSEAFIAALNLPEDRLRTRPMLVDFIHTVAKRMVITSFRKRTVRKKHIDELEKFLYPTLEVIPTGGIFDYYPVNLKKINEGIVKLDRFKQFAIVAIMYSIPLNSMSKLLGRTSENLMHSDLITAIRQLKRHLNGHKYATHGHLKPNPLSDQVWQLYLQKTPYKVIGEMTGLNERAVTMRIFNRKKLRTKYPDYYNS